MAMVMVMMPLLVSVRFVVVMMALVSIVLLVALVMMMFVTLLVMSLLAVFLVMLRALEYKWYCYRQKVTGIEQLAKTRLMR